VHYSELYPEISLCHPKHNICALFNTFWIPNCANLSISLSLSCQLNIGRPDLICMYVHQNPYICVYLKTLPHIHTQTWFVCVYRRTRTYACIFKLICMGVLQNCAYAHTWWRVPFADSTLELNIRNISNMNISGSFTILQTNRYRSISQWLKPRARSEMQSTFGDSMNVWMITSQWPPVDLCSGGYHCEHAFRSKHWEVADCQYSCPTSMLGSDVHMLAMYNVVSTGMFFTDA
jgi:hypothetical protein